MGLLGAMIKQAVKEYVMMCERGYIRDGKVDGSLFPLKALNMHFTAQDANILKEFLFGGNGKLLIEELTCLNFNTLVRMTFKKYGRPDLFT